VCVTFCHQIRAGFVKVLITIDGTSCALHQGMKWLKWLKHGFVILTLYIIALLEGHFLPRYGIEWMLAAMGVTAFLAGFGIRTHWDV
jgi:hypothetical protein